MSSLDKDSFYMNPVTGSIAKGSDWIQDQRDIGFDIDELDLLIEVDENGEEL